MSRTKHHGDGKKIPSGSHSYKKMMKKKENRKIRYNKDFSVSPDTRKTIYWLYW